nr:DNA-directed DNA polymerase [Tanacetum cinerariifolium]
MTATLKYMDVPNDAIKLMLFSYSLEGAARIWYEKKPPNSNLTWDDLETFGEAWDRFKEMLRACPHHGFSELTQIDTFYNGLTEQDYDSLNAVSGGNLLNKTTREALKIIENKSKVDKLADQILNLVEIVNKQVIAPAKAVKKTCVTYGGAHAYHDCIATDSNQPSVCAATGSYNQVSPPNRASHQIPPPGFALVQNNPNRFNQNQVPNNQIPPSVPNEFLSYVKSNEIMIKSMQNQINVLRGDFNKQEENLRKNLNDDLRNILSSFFQNQPSTSDEQTTEEILDKEHSNSSGSTAQVQPPVVPISILEPDVPRTQTKPTIPYPFRLNDQKLREKATNQMEKFFQIFRVLHFDISFADALFLMPKFASTIKSLLANKDKLFELAKVSLNENCSAMLLKKLPEKLGDPDVIDIACEEFVQDVLDFQYNPKICSPTLVSDASISENDVSKEPIVKSSSPTLTSFGESDFFLDEIEDFLNDDSIPTRIENSVYDPEGGILFLEKLLNEDPFQLPLMELKLAEESKEKSFVEEPPELELKELPEALINVLKSHKWAIAWKISDIKGINPRFCTHKILMEDDYKPAVQSQRRVNPKIHDVIKKEVIKLLDAGMIYPISDSPWVSPIHCVPKKGGMTVVVNENNELIPTRLITGWRVCIDYRKLNDATRKDHFSLPFMDQMLKRLAGNEFYCFLDGFSGYVPKVYDVYFYDMIEKMMEVFMDDFSVFGDSFSSCLTYLDKMLNLCEETNLVLNWEKCHFMCREGIVLGHKILDSGIEVDRAKVDVIVKLPHPTTVKGVRSFLGHAAVDYLSKWVKVKALPTNDARVVFKFLNSLFSRFGIPRAIISDRRTHFCKDQFTRVMIKYGVTHRLATAYHPQTSGQVEVSNRGLKRILERTVGENRASWTKKLHDSKIKNRIFNVGDQVLLFNSHLKIFSRKLKTHWSGPFTITRVFPYGTIELSQPNGLNFNVNGHRVKHYFGGDIPSNVALDLHTIPTDN